MAEKAIRETLSQLPRRLRFRLRHIILTILVICAYLYTSSVLARRSPYQIQARFPPEDSVAKAQRLHRRSQVEDAFKHSWKGYKDHAWLHDELLPVSGGQKDPFVGWAATLVDSMDSLYIMGLYDEFELAVKALEQIDFSKPHADNVPVFEVTIRYLGGLLGAWDISGGTHPALLRKATELGDFLSKAFEWVPFESILPVNAIISAHLWRYVLAPWYSLVAALVLYRSPVSL